MATWSNCQLVHEKNTFFIRAKFIKILCMRLRAVMGRKHQEKKLKIFNYFNPKWWLDQLAIGPSGYGRTGNGPTGNWTN
jgi:hypothetical protein